MKSGLVGRNNVVVSDEPGEVFEGLNEVRPSRPEQSCDAWLPVCPASECLNEVRPSRPEQLDLGNLASA